MRAKLALHAFVVALIVGGSWGSSHAAEITGSIHFNGGLQTDTSDLANVEKMTLLGGFVTFPAPTGTFADENVSLFSDVHFFENEIQFYDNDTDSIVFVPSPVVNLWQVGTAGEAGYFAFSLESISTVTRGSNQVSITGTGTLSGFGYDDTDAAWAISFDQDNDGNLTFGFSANSSTLAGGGGAIPEPATLSLFGLSSAFIALRSRRRQKPKNV